MKLKNKPMETTQKPRPNLMDCISFWKGKSVKEKKEITEQEDTEEFVGEEESDAESSRV